MRRRITLVAVVLLAVALGAVAARALNDQRTVQTVRTVVVTAPATTTTRTATGSLAAMARAASAGVVTIQATASVNTPPSPFRPPSSEEEVASGSGFVLDAQGHILTSQHLIAGATKIHVALADGHKKHAELVASDPLLDLAVLVVDVPAATLHPLPLGAAEALRPGDSVVAVGNPFQLERSVSSGVVSALHREMLAPNGFTVANAIQTDVAINHGSSGGPLLDIGGNVVGVAAQIADSGVDANVGVAFAVAIDPVARRAITTLKTGGTVRHPWLGAALADIDAILATSGRVASQWGALITGVVVDGPAARAGLNGGSQIATVDGASYCVGGDIIVAVAGRKVTDAGDLAAALASRKPGDEIKLAVVRASGGKDVITLTLGTAPTSAPDVTTGCS